MRVLYDKDGDLSLIKDKEIAIIGYGSQGHAHAQNLQNSGMKTTVGLRKNSLSWEDAINFGLRVKEIEESVQNADIVMILIPDEEIKEVYETQIAMHIKKGSALAFAHGFSIQYNQVIPSNEVDVIMIAPKAPGPSVRLKYKQGSGVPHLIAVHQNVTGFAREIALSYAIANGGGKTGIIETTFREETETDLFGEQAVLCGGVVELIKAGFETLIDAGYKAEISYFECLHELKLIVDLIYEGGIQNMNKAISNNAEYGGYTTGSSIITNDTKIAMQKCLKNIQNGQYAKNFILEKQTNKPILNANRHLISQHQIERVGQKLRAMIFQNEKNNI